VRRTGFDLIIAGAGPAGLATAIRAALAGLDTVVLERRRGDLDKACGEGLMPGAVASLETMGVTLAPQEYQQFHGIRYLDGRLSAEGRFRRGAGLGVRRTMLSNALQSRAADLGVEIRLGCPVESWKDDGASVSVCIADATLWGRYLIAADGLHSRIRRELGLDMRQGRVRRLPLRFGVRRHYSVSLWTDLVEIHLADSVEAYVTPVGADTIGVALLFGPVEGDSTFEALLGRFPALQERLATATGLDVPLGAGPFRQRVRRRFAGRVALVGDAAGYIDALTGQGLDLSFASATALADVIRAGETLEEYERAYRRLGRRYRPTVELLLRVVRRRASRAGMVRLLRAQPWLFDRLLDAVGGQSPGSRHNVDPRADAGEP
jgi:flavin-dependent dehydrogenase